MQLRDLASLSVASLRKRQNQSAEQSIVHRSRAPTAWATSPSTQPPGTHLQEPANPSPGQAASSRSYIESYFILVSFEVTPGDAQGSPLGAWGVIKPKADMCKASTSHAVLFLQPQILFHVIFVVGSWAIYIPRRAHGLLLILCSGVIPGDSNQGGEV